MLAYPDIDPVAFQLGPLKVHWYGLMYLVAFGLGWWLGRLRARDPWRGWRGQDVDDVLFFVAVGVIVGGRLGYALFYDGGRVLQDPMHLFAVWQGGMSFHGGLVGVLLAMALFARRRGRTFFEVADFVAPLVPLGLAAGRIGNFINGNLWGKATDLPWGMVFPDPRAGGIPRHPSQLYQALLEGVALFVVLWWFSRRPRPAMAVSGLFLIGYAVARGAVELVRVPDAQLGYLAFGWLTMGQLLTAPMLVAGVALMLVSRHRAAPELPASKPARPAPSSRGGRRRGRARP